MHGLQAVLPVVAAMSRTQIAGHHSLAGSVGTSGRLFHHFTLQTALREFFHEVKACVGSSPMAYPACVFGEGSIIESPPECPIGEDFHQQPPRWALGVVDLHFVPHSGNCARLFCALL